MENQKLYEEVACLCSQFKAKKDCDCYSNTTGEPKNVSCTSCSHFINHHCNIDYYDQIVSNHDLA